MLKFQSSFSQVVSGTLISFYFKHVDKHSNKTKKQLSPNA